MAVEPTRHCSKPFAHIESFNVHNSSIMQILFSSSSHAAGQRQSQDLTPESTAAVCAPEAGLCCSSHTATSQPLARPQAWRAAGAQEIAINYAARRIASDHTVLFLGLFP